MCCLDNLGFLRLFHWNQNCVLFKEHANRSWFILIFSLYASLFLYLMNSIYILCTSYRWQVKEPIETVLKRSSWRLRKRSFQNRLLPGLWIGLLLSAILSGRTMCLSLLGDVLYDATRFFSGQFRSVEFFFFNVYLVTLSVLHITCSCITQMTQKSRAKCYTRCLIFKLMRLYST